MVTLCLIWENKISLHLHLNVRAATLADNILCLALETFREILARGARSAAYSLVFVLI
jgi:hypothetical protein